MNVERGCPQGSIAGPFIWNLMMGELLGELSTVAESVAYVDELLILVEGNSRIRTVNAWSLKVGVSSPKGNLCPPPLIELNKANLKYRKTVT